MSKLLGNLDEVLGTLTKYDLTALQHAVEISPFITERSIGADLAVWIDADEEQQQKTEEDQTQQNVEKTKVKAQKQQETSPPRCSSLHALDYATINQSIIMREAEQQRNKRVQEEMHEMRERHKAALRRSAEHERQQQAERTANWLAEKKRNEERIQCEAEQLAEKELQECVQQREQMRKQTEQQLQLISFQGVAQYQSRFRAKYELVAKLLMSIDKQALLSCQEYNSKLKELIQMFEQLIGKLKTGECGPPELKSAASLCAALDDLEASIVGELENIIKRREQQLQQQAADDATKLEVEARKQQEEQELQQQHLQQQQQQEQQQQQIAAEATAAAANTETTTAATMPVSESAVQFISAERLKFYEEIKGFHQEKLNKITPLKDDEQWKKYCAACKRAINLAINAIAAVSPQHLQDKYIKLQNLLSGANDHPLGRDYCLLAISEKFVRQGDTEVSSNPKAAFPIASVIVSLWKLMPDFGKLFLSNIYTECPLLVPYLIPYKRGQPHEDYCKVLGYRIVDGQIEKQEMYLKRQAGIARLYAAVLITSGRQADGPMHPYGIEQGWCWLANFVNLEPLPDISATLLLIMLQTIGADLWSTYGKQFVKLLLYIKEVYFPKLTATDDSSPKARLKQLLEQFSAGQIEKPLGTVEPGFW